MERKMIMLCIISRNTNQMCFKEHQELVWTYSRKKGCHLNLQTLQLKEGHSGSSLMSTARGIQSKWDGSDLQQCAWTGPSELQNNSRKDASRFVIGPSTITSGPLGSYECIYSSSFLSIVSYFRKRMLSLASCHPSSRLCLCAQSKINMSVQFNQKPVNKAKRK